MAKIKLTAEQNEIIKTCAGYGMTIEEISFILGMGRATLNRRLVDNELVRDAYDEGRAKAKQAVVKKLFELINQGEAAAIFFYLKCQCGWREKQEVQAEVKGAEIKIYLPEKDSDFSDV